MDYLKPQLSNCSYCISTATKAQQKLHLRKFPQILIVHLQRTMKIEEGAPSYSKEEINFDQTNLSIGSFTGEELSEEEDYRSYNLFSTINIENNGNFVSYCKSGWNYSSGRCVQIFLQDICLLYHI